MILFALAFAFVIAGCDGNAVFEKKIDGFENNRWEKARPLQFSVDVEKAGNYSFDIFFSHVYGYQFPEIPMILEIQYPGGRTEKEELVIAIKDADGNDSGDCAGDYCDLWHTVQPPSTLEPGHYEVRLINDFQGPFLPNILGIGLKVSLQE